MYAHHTECKRSEDNRMPEPIESEQIDVAATIAMLRTQAVARGKAMGLTEQAALDDPLRQAADLAHISAHFPIMWRIPILGRMLALVQRAMRIGLRWYINPIVDQINDFNEATVTALNTITARQEALAARIAALELGDVPSHADIQSPLSHTVGEGPGVGAS